LIILIKVYNIVAPNVLKLPWPTT